MVMAKARRGNITVDGFEGVNDLLNPFDLGDLEGNWLVDAQNVDIDDGKSIKRRPGTVKLDSFTNPHSLWSDGDRTLFAEQGNLHRVDQLTDTTISATIVLSGAGDTKFGYAKAHDKIYFSNEKKNGMLLADGTFHGWGVETPSGQPSLSTTTGALKIEKSVSVFVAYIDDLGRESGASGISTLETSGTTGVQLTNIPVPSSSEVENKVIYATPPDGDEFYMIDVVSTGTTTYSITSLLHKTVHAETLFLSAPPLGSLVGAESGRVFVAKGKNLYMSEPLMYHLFNMREGYFPFPEDISIIATVEGGIYVAADQTYFIPLTGEPELATVLPYGAVPGSVTYLAGEDIGEGQGQQWAGWISEHGYVLAGPGGSIRNITEDRTAIKPANEGASISRSDNGYTRLTATYRPGGESAGVRATDYVEATVVKSPAVSTLNTADNYNYTADSEEISADAE